MYSIQFANIWLNRNSQFPCHFLPAASDFFTSFRPLFHTSPTKFSNQLLPFFPYLNHFPHCFPPANSFTSFTSCLIGKGPLWRAGVSQPPFLIALAGKFTDLGAEYNVRGLGRGDIAPDEVPNVGGRCWWKGYMMGWTWFLLVVMVMVLRMKKKY